MPDRSVDRPCRNADERDWGAVVPRLAHPDNLVCHGGGGGVSSGPRLSNGGQGSDETASGVGRLVVGMGRRRGRPRSSVDHNHRALNQNPRRHHDKKNGLTIQQAGRRGIDALLFGPTGAGSWPAAAAEVVGLAAVVRGRKPPVASEFKASVRRRVGGALLLLLLDSRVLGWVGRKMHRFFLIDRLNRSNRLRFIHPIGLNHTISSHPDRPNRRPTSTSAAN